MWRLDYAVDKPDPHLQSRHVGPLEGGKEKLVAMRLALHHLQVKSFVKLDTVEGWQLFQLASQIYLKNFVWQY